MTLTYVVADLNGGTTATMTADEETAFLAAQSSSQTTSSIAALISQSQSALDKSDLVANRCFKAGVAFPSDWQTYVTALRAIVSSGTGTIPTKPSYPVGT